MYMYKTESYEIVSRVWYKDIYSQETDLLVNIGQVLTTFSQGYEYLK